MVAYNAEMNRRIYADAAKLTDMTRREDRGLFWKSLHGALNHRPTPSPVAKARR